MTNRPLILITNDDGVQAQGIHVLTRLMATLGDVVVVAPDGPRSGAACAITPVDPVHIRRVDMPLSPLSDGVLPSGQDEEEQGEVTAYTCSGTPTDCVKLALEKIVPRRPDLVVSGINHGDNASISLHYSGTIGAVLEACMKGVPAIGYSLRTHDKRCDFRPYSDVIVRVARHVLQHGLSTDVCLNVNFPQVTALAGTRVCRMARGNWNQEWRETEQPGTYQLTGFFTNLEPEADDTDYWALDHAMAAITPMQLDVTSYPTLERLKDLND